MKQLEAKLEELIKAARKLKEDMPATPVAAPKATAKPMGANAKPVLARRHKVGQSEPTSQSRPKLAEPHRAHIDIPEDTEKAEMCKFDKNGQWSLNKPSKKY
jgi:hypothetical protein